MKYLTAIVFWALLALIGTFVLSVWGGLLMASGFLAVIAYARSHEQKFTAQGKDYLNGIVLVGGMVSVFVLSMLRGKAHYRYAVDYPWLPYLSMTIDVTLAIFAIIYAASTMKEEKDKDPLGIRRGGR